MDVHWGFLMSSPKTGCGRSESDDHMHGVVELRKAKRYPLSAPALFMWARQDGKPQNGHGTTRDINTLGVYVLTDALPPVGALVQMEIVLPKLVDSGPGMHLTGDGIVLRCESSGAKGVGVAGGGFAASVQFYPESTESVLSAFDDFRASHVSPGLMHLRGM